MDDRIAEVIRKGARRNHSLLVRGMAQVSQKRVADLIGISEGTLSTLKAEQLERLAALIAACGLKLSAVTDQTFDEAYISALKTLATVGLGHEPRHDDGGDL